MGEEEAGTEIAIPGILTLHPDGSVTRYAPTSEDDIEVLPSSNLCRDLLLTHPPAQNGNCHHVRARLYVPPHPPPPVNRLPLIVFFHGGGFVSQSPASRGTDSLCEKLAAATAAVVLSIGYRLAPEHRLPAAFEDGYAALLWLREQARACGGEQLQSPSPSSSSSSTTSSDPSKEPPSFSARVSADAPSSPSPVSARVCADVLPSSSASVCAEPWLACVDFGMVFLAGVSAGASIVHHVAMRAVSSEQELKPLSLRGLAMVVPFLGGEERTPLELAQATTSTLPLQGCDNCWALSLPKGATRDHPFCTLAAGDGLLSAPMRLPAPWPPSLVIVGGKDILHGRQLTYVADLKRAGKDVELVTFPEADHFMSGTHHHLMLDEIARFIHAHR